MQKTKFKENINLQCQKISKQSLIINKNITWNLPEDLWTRKYETIHWIRLFAIYAGTWKNWTSLHNQNLLYYN